MTLASNMSASENQLSAQRNVPGAHAIVDWFTAAKAMSIMTMKPTLSPTLADQLPHSLSKRSRNNGFPRPNSRHDRPAIRGKTPRRCARPDRTDRIRLERRRPERRTGTRVTAPPRSRQRVYCVASRASGCRGALGSASPDRESRGVFVHSIELLAQSNFVSLRLRAVSVVPYMFSGSTPSELVFSQSTTAGSR